MFLAFGLLVVSSSLAADVNQEKVDQIFANYQKAGSPGCSVGVIRDSNFIYRRGYGMASLELGVPLSHEWRRHSEFSWPVNCLTGKCCADPLRPPDLSGPTNTQLSVVSVARAEDPNHAKRKPNKCEYTDNEC
jgi:hypothetical protein